jgi:ERCC4-type nuclease
MYDASAGLDGMSSFPTGAVMRIIADCHEPTEILNLLRTADVDGSAVEIEVGLLDIGDYLIGPGAAVERKAGGDFAASLSDGRMAEQAAKLPATYDKVVWIIEGNPYDKSSRSL